MDKDIQNRNAAWISVFMRIALIIYLGFSGVRKVMNGVGGTVDYFQEVYAGTGTPMWLVTGQAWIVPYLEVILFAWLLIGYKLRGAYIACALLLLNFCGAMKILGKGETVVDNAVFVVVCCVGLYFAHRDCWSVDGCLARRKEDGSS